ncbi:CAP domain-containing protein [Infundibulicybe gibba]|nr:CAP domain-containing protein [Infundibulicybe gibba]
MISSTLFVLFTVLYFLTGSITAAAVIPQTPGTASPTQIAEFLESHNSVRALHRALPLVWSTSLAAKAASFADACRLDHTYGTLSDTPYGENIIAATGSFPITDAVKAFVQDESEYRESPPVYNHFTQVVWKSTTTLGCGVATCDGMLGRRKGPATFYVCLYDPVGNVIGENKLNVQP